MESKMLVIAVLALDGGIAGCWKWYMVGGGAMVARTRCLPYEQVTISLRHPENCCCW